MNASVKCPNCGTVIDNVNAPARTARWFTILSILPTPLILILVFVALGIAQTEG